MNSVLSRINPRERRLLVMMAPVAMLLVLLLVGKSLLTQRNQASDHLGRALEDIAWLQAQSAALPARGRQCPPASWNPKGIAALAGRYSVNLAAAPVVANGELRLEVSSADGNKLIELMSILSCQGAQFQTFELANDPGADSVHGSLVAELPVT